MAKVKIKSSNSSSSSSRSRKEHTNTTGLHERPEISIHFEAGPPVLKPLDDDKREGPRYKVNFEATLMHGAIAFRTKLINMSMVGVLLQEQIPESLIKKPLNLLIVHSVHGKRETLLLKAEALEAPLRSARIRFTELGNPEKEKLELLFKKLPPA